VVRQREADHETLFDVSPSKCLGLVVVIGLGTCQSIVRSLEKPFCRCFERKEHGMKEKVIMLFAGRSEPLWAAAADAPQGPSKV
jgi:hypothetical protein